MQMLESEHAIHEHNNQTIRGNRSNRSNPDRIRGKINRSIIRGIRRTTISHQGTRTTKTSGNDSSAATRSKPGVARCPASFTLRVNCFATEEIGVLGRR
jgi:hypothetical protein